ncbi:alpha/beta fold hydrolase [Candidatus Arsenophonus nilaparvatae]|uniref:non-ribosomal peptide synthetase n=1 Tax=Candidatus Arsenophonus nilaparvatae TaxID=1247023 RepID=UPI0005093FA3|nr:non-ribosomal peptide synthetase [Candidatus Arsenophonus nilaparvatae]
MKQWLATKWENAFYLSDKSSDNAEISNTLFSIKLTGELNRDIFMLALSHALKQPSFQWTFLWQNELKKCHVEVPTQGEYYDFSQHDSPQQSGQDNLNALYQHRLIPGVTPLFKWCLCYLGKNDQRMEHVLNLVIHHLIIDGTSFRQFMFNVQRFYQLLIESQPLPQWASPECYFINQQPENNLTQSELALAEQRAQDLIGQPCQLMLPRSSYKNEKVESKMLSLPETLVKSIQVLADKHNATRHIILQAIFVGLLHRLSGQNDIFMLSPVSMRPISRGEEGGCWVNTVILGHHFTADLSWSNLFEQIILQRKRWKAAKHIPLANIINALRKQKKEHSLERFNLMFAETVALNHSYRFSDGVTVCENYEFIESSNDLQLLYCQAENGEIHLRLNIAPTINQDGLFNAFMVQYQTALETVLVNSDQRIIDLPLLTPAMIAKIDQRNATAVAWPDHTLAQQFYTHVLEQPDHIALIDDVTGQQWSYGQLHQIATHIANHLNTMFTDPRQMIVMLHIEPLAQLVIAILAVQYAGMIYYCIDRSAPEERKAVMKGVVQPDLLLVDQPQMFALALPQLEISLLLEEAQTSLFDAISPLSQRPKGSVEDLSHLIFTSGTTGTPKGVALSHQSVMSTLYQPRHLPVSQRVLYSANETFDCATLQLWSAWIHGATVITPERKAIADPQRMQKLIENYQPDNIFLATGLFDSYMQSVKAALFSTVDTVIFGGDVVNPTAVRAAQQAGVKNLFNIYGPAETCVYSFAYAVRSQINGPVPLGWVSNNMQVYILDSQQQHVPDGAIGELYFVGQGLARGYHHRPDLDENAFVEITLPGSKKEKVRAYRSGDYGFWSEEGLIFVGRRDDQVKIRGYRVELKEVRLALEAVSGVILGVVIAPGEAGHRELHGFYISNNSLDSSQVRKELADKLPEYMVPRYLQQIEKMPLTVNGKFDLRALEAMRVIDRPRNDKFIAPRNDIEMKLYTLFSQLFLNVTIDIHSHFFELGGSSLDALRLVNLVEKEIGQILSLTELIRYPTIEQLAVLLRTRTRGSQQQNVRADNLMTFRDGKRHLICIHPGGGTAYCYLKLANALNRDLGIHGIQAQGLKEGESFLPSFDAMADHYLTQIEHLLSQPHILCGWSLGGLMALLMARKIQQRGFHHSKIIMFDTGYPYPEMVRCIPQMGLDEFKQKLCRFDGIFPDIREEDIDRYHRLYNHHRLLLTGITEVPHFSGRAWLIQVRDKEYTFDIERAAAAWRQVIPQLVALPTSGNHWSLMDPPHVQKVATIVENIMAEHCQEMGEEVCI